MNRDATGSRLIIVCGLPGSGKTTVARALEGRLSAIRFCPDEWMEALSLDIYDEEKRAKVESLQWDLARGLLRKGQIVIIEWGTWGRSERDALRKGARELGAAVELHYLHASEEALFDRIQRRGMENPRVTRDDLSRWRAMFQAPTGEEFDLFDPPLLNDFEYPRE
jgi:predicted kinase